jgi:hypothetical protein
MSNRKGDGYLLWNIRGPGLDVLFAGSLWEMIGEVGGLDRKRGLPHAAMEIRP